jgi:hypothetical protein
VTSLMNNTRRRGMLGALAFRLLGRSIRGRRAKQRLRST